MKRLCSLSLFLCTATYLSGQPLLRQAIALKPLFQYDENKMLVMKPNVQSDTITSIIRSYIPNETAGLGFKVRQAFDGNPFIDMGNAPQGDWDIKRGKPVNMSSPSASSGFSVTNLADGLARFLVNRTKQELSIAFFNNFKKKIENDPYLGNFCPLTKTQLGRIDAEVYQFNDYLESLREAFSADMTALPGSTERYLRDPSLCQDCLQKPEGKVITDMLHIAQQMVNGEPPVDMIGYLALKENGSAIQTADASQPKLYNMAGGLRFLNIVSESFQNPEANPDAKGLMPWYTAKEIRAQFRDPVVLQIYLGLLWQKAKDIEFVDDSGTGVKKMRELMRTGQNVVLLVESWRKTIESFGDLTQSLQYALKSSAGTSTTVADDFFSYSQSFTDLLQAVNQTGRNLRGANSKDIIPGEYILLTRQCNALYFNVRQRNFAGALGNVLYCLNLMNEELLQKKDLKGAEKEKQEKASQGIAALLKYANFMAAIAEATSPEEMEQAIEHFALPPGSSSMKKPKGRFSVALNAYAGLAIGAEFLKDETKPKTVSGVSAPVGISCSWGIGTGGSLGLFVPLIDVGAVTAYRFDNNNTQSLPELTWSNIFAPGVYAVWDFPRRLPFALGLGWQSGPNLRKISNGVTKSGNRLGAFLTVDIPITYFYLGKDKE